jgi:hypothetical protein
VSEISVLQLLEVLARFDEFGGASAGLVAWDVFVDEQDVRPAWEHAIAEGWLNLSGRGQGDEPLYRLTLAGWAAARERCPGLKAGAEAAEESR